MMFTDRALAANIITKQEADTLEDWIDANIAPDITATVPAELYDLFGKVALFNDNGRMQ